MALTICPGCSKGVWPGEAKGNQCPHCGQKLRASLAVRLAVGLLMVLVAIGGLVLFGGVLGGIHANDPPSATTGAR